MLAVKIKAIIFDKDGTLFDIQRSWSKWCNIFISKFCKVHALKPELLAQALNFDLESGLFKKDSIFVHGSIDEVIDKVHSVFPKIEGNAIHICSYSACEKLVIIILKCKVELNSTVIFICFFDGF